MLIMKAFMSKNENRVLNEFHSAFPRTALETLNILNNPQHLKDPAPTAETQISLCSFRWMLLSFCQCGQD